MVDLLAVRNVGRNDRAPRRCLVAAVAAAETDQRDPNRPGAGSRQSVVDGIGSGSMAQALWAYFSRISVTGPSLTSSTSIMAPNSPVATVIPLPAPRSLSKATKCSYRGMAASGGAAPIKEGRRPFDASP